MVPRNSVNLLILYFHYPRYACQECSFRTVHSTDGSFGRVPREDLPNMRHHLHRDITFVVTLFCAPFAPRYERNILDLG